MKIKIENFFIETNEHGNFNLVELKKSKKRETGKEVVSESILFYSVSVEHALKRIVHKNLHKNPNIVTLKQYIVELRNETKKINKLYELEMIK